MATIDFDFRNQIIQSDIGSTLAYCYQCATCSGACPVAQVTNGKYNPRRLILDALLGLKEKIFGKEPEYLVTSVLYRFSRNPMYLGVIILIFGIGIILESISIVSWFILLWLGFHIVVVKFEEPHLREKFGQSYVNYCKKTPRWMGFPRFKYQDS